MEAMYIQKGSVIIIGDTVSGTADTGIRYFGYSLREAISTHRRRFGLVGKRFEKILQDGQLFIRRDNVWYNAAGLRVK